MFRAASALLLAAVTVFGAATAARAASAQSLSVDLLADGPQIYHLGSYAASVPIAVRVTAPGAREAALLGVAPNGTNLRLPLARERGGVYAGLATLATPGTWTLAVATTAAAGEITTTNSFPIVVDAGPSPVDVALLLVLAFASVGGGVGLIAVGRGTARTRTDT